MLECDFHTSNFYNLLFADVYVKLLFGQSDHVLGHNVLCGKNLGSLIFVWDVNCIWKTSSVKKLKSSVNGLGAEKRTTSKKYLHAVRKTNQIIELYWLGQRFYKNQTFHHNRNEKLNSQKRTMYIFSSVYFVRVGLFSFLFAWTDFRYTKITGCNGKIKDKAMSVNKRNVSFGLFYE